VRPDSGKGKVPEMRRQNFLFLFLPFFILPRLCAQQSGSIKGVVIDEAGLILPFVQIQLFQKIKGINQLETYDWADSSGYFQLFYTGPLSQAFLIFNAIGRQSDTLPLETQLAAAVDLGSIVLKESPLPLNEILIKEKAISYYQRGDTTIFKPSFYQDGSEKVLEDLLAKLPGVRVADDGFLYFRGKRVSKVLWDGDDMLGNDYAKGTKRMPAGIAEEFRFLDKFEGNPLLKSMNRSDQLVLDIEVKKNFKGKWIGDAFLGFGFDPFLTAGLSGYRIQKKVKFLSFAEGNSFHDLAPEKKINFEDTDELNSSFQPNYLMSWFVFPSFFPSTLTQARFNRGKRALFTGGPHWKLGKESYMHLHVDGVLAGDFFQQNNSINQFTSQRAWQQEWQQREHSNRILFDGNGRIKISEKSNLTFFLRRLEENVSVCKTDSISGIFSLPFFSTEQWVNKKISGDFHTDWLWKPDSKKVWRFKTWFRRENMGDEYNWRVKREIGYNGQHVVQSNLFGRIQGFYIASAYQFEVGTHLNQNLFNAFYENVPDISKRVRLAYYMVWFGGKREWTQKAHRFSFSGNAGPAVFRVFRPGAAISKNTLLVEGQVRYKWNFSKKWYLESVCDISPVLPDAGQVFKGQVRTGILQRETGMDDLVIPRSTWMRNKIHFSDNKRQWESQVMFTLNFKSPFLGNNIVSGEQADWLIQKFAFNLSKGAVIQWNLDKYLIEQSASLGLQLSASRQEYLYGLNQISGENIFYHFTGKGNVSLLVGKLKTVLSPAIYVRRTKTANGAIATLTQLLYSGNLVYHLRRNSYLKFVAEYLPKTTTGSRNWLWARLEGKFAVNEKNYLSLELKNLFNKRNLTLGDLSADSQFMQEFQLNRTMVGIKWYINF
jgi:hypothetical protein